ncbi:ribonuclease P protein component [Adlercreutzia mucosicola]|uniref:Ribonuclease P protein component n=1 Tax=Adlercreutzia mucosicola TaxID=580026 RepID=A0A6N8JKA4_9ACTN|nr:ribonuclease P protein component [Adlercreutzia mucosicola]MCI9494865.1 ribonuclease P protein component [Adlercreutzia mucosicola]MCR2034038.1 ribonuclease P protein component [Adlercreutzia mucosicola]MVX60315.1 ribonuclease P protein component [Adlercreutzia mucosicola]
METITSSAEISQLFSNGKRVKTPYVTLIVGERRCGKPRGDEEQHGPGGRVAFIAGKKLGNAVWRNQAKRRMRAVCHELGGPWPDFDVIFLAKSSLCQVPYGKVLQACGDATRRLSSGKEGCFGEKGPRSC